MADSHEQCRQKAIEIGAEYLLHWEVDVFTLYRSVIERMLMHNKQVVSGVYHISHGNDSHLCLVQRKKMHPLEPATAFVLRNGADLMFVDGTLKEIGNAGIGCSLIHKSVFEKISFRADKNEQVHPDSTWAVDLFQHGIKTYADTSLVFQHRNQKWLHY